MKKLALILGTIILAANASAEEVAAAPILPAFKPSGFVSMEQKYYGKGEHDDVTHNFFRTEFKGSVKMTAVDELQWRVRSYDDLNSEGTDGAKKENNSETRYRWIHKFGTLEGTKIQVSTRAEVKQRDDTDKYEGQLRLNFADYIPDASWMDTTTFQFAPKLRYIEYGETDDGAVGAGMDFAHYAILPLGLEWEFNAYYIYNDNTDDGYRNSSQAPSGSFDDSIEDTSSSNNLDIEAYLYWNHMMWESQDGFYSLNAYAEGGLDALTYRDGDGDTNNNSIYFMPEAQFNININPSTSILVSAGIEYRNWTSDEMSAIKDFTWQPYTSVMVKTVF